MLASRKGKEAAHMEAQTGKLFRPGDEVVHVVEAVEQRAGERALLYNAMSAAASGAEVVSAAYVAIFGAVLQVVVALLLRFLADVFEYGVELQQLSDETL